MKMRLGLASLMVLALLLAACSGTAGSSGPMEIMVQAAGMTYQPATIEVTAGQPVQITFQNMDSVDHDLSIMEFPMEMMGATQEPMAGHDMGGMTEQPELHMAALMGQNAVLEFTPSKPGTYEFFCTVAGHKEAGMVGTMVVNAP